MSADYHEIVREPECERITGLSRTTRWRLENKSKFPKRRKLTQNTHGWYRGEILDWQRAREPA